jgi:GNAT superfamily N-acetyltransferase
MIQQGVTEFTLPHNASVYNIKWANAMNVIAARLGAAESRIKCSITDEMSSKFAKLAKGGICAGQNYSVCRRLDDQTRHRGLLRLPCRQAAVSAFNRAGLEQDWARLQAESGQVDSHDAAATIFRQEFLKDRDLASRQCLFVIDESTDDVVATASLWYGDHFGERHARIHWVTVAASHQGRGLAKALLSRLLEQHREQSPDWLYLTTQTWSYKRSGSIGASALSRTGGPDRSTGRAAMLILTGMPHGAWDLIERKIASR